MTPEEELKSLQKKTKIQIYIAIINAIITIIAGVMVITSI